MFYIQLEILNLFHVFKLAPTTSTVQEMSFDSEVRALTLDVRDVVVLDVLACPLLHGILYNFIGQALCILNDHSVGLWGFLHFFWDFGDI